MVLLRMQFANRIAADIMFRENVRKKDRKEVSDFDFVFVLDFCRSYNGEVHGAFFFFLDSIEAAVCEKQLNRRVAADIMLCEIEKKDGKEFSEFVFLLDFCRS